MPSYACLDEFTNALISITETMLAIDGVVATIRDRHLTVLFCRLVDVSKFYIRTKGLAVCILTLLWGYPVPGRLRPATAASLVISTSRRRVEAGRGHYMDCCCRHGTPALLVSVLPSCGHLSLI